MSIHDNSINNSTLLNKEELAMSTDKTPNTSALDNTINNQSTGDTMETSDTAQDTAPTPHFPLPTCPMHRRARGELVGGEVGWWACGGRVWGRRRGRSGPLEVRSVRSRGTASRACAFLLILRFLRTLCAVACASRVAQTFCYTRVCLLCVCGSGVFSPLHPLRSLPQSILFS